VNPPLEPAGMEKRGEEKNLLDMKAWGLSLTRVGDIRGGEPLAADPEEEGRKMQGAESRSLQRPFRL